MALDQECQRKVVKKLSQEEGKKEEKFSQHNKLDKLRKRSEFLGLRKKCSTFHGTTIISNYKISDTQPSKVGLTVTKKVGSAVVRNRIKRILRAAIHKHRNLFVTPLHLEIIAKKEILKFKFEVIEKDIKNIFKKIS
jgi:ribonuclease P protein component